MNASIHRPTDAIPRRIRYRIIDGAMGRGKGEHWRFMSVTFCRTNVRHFAAVSVRMDDARSPLHPSISSAMPCAVCGAATVKHAHSPLSFILLLRLIITVFFFSIFRMCYVSLRILLRWSEWRTRRERTIYGIFIFLVFHPLNRYCVINAMLESRWTSSALAGYLNRASDTNDHAVRQQQ